MRHADRRTRDRLIGIGYLFFLSLRETYELMISRSVKNTSVVRSNDCNDLNKTIELFIRNNMMFSVLRLLSSSSKLTLF